MLLRVTAKPAQIEDLQQLFAVSTQEKRVDGTVSLVLDERDNWPNPLLEVCATDGHMWVRPASYSDTPHDPDPPGLWTTDHLRPEWEVCLELGDSELLVTEINIRERT